MNTQYVFDDKLIEILIEENDENNNIFLQKSDFIIKDNNLYNKKNLNDIVLENVDNFLINKIIERKILFKSNKDNLVNSYYSIKGIMNNISFKKEDGDKFWEEFLSSNILNDIVNKLYNKENIFNKKIVIDLFKERSYYFPNYNTSFLALTHKELFTIYFPPSEIQFPDISLKNSSIMRMINKAINKIKVHHEWGHASSAFLFFNRQIKYFTTPERSIKFKEKDNEKVISEGGKAVEYLLYGRVLSDKTAKEAIFILNSDNYKLPLKEFYQKFININQHNLEDIFKEANANPNTDPLVKEAYIEYKRKGNNFRGNIEYYSFKFKENKKKKIDLEKISFKIGKNYHPRYPYKTNNITIA